MELTGIPCPSMEIIENEARAATSLARATFVLARATLVLSREPIF